MREERKTTEEEMTQAFVNRSLSLNGGFTTLSSSEGTPTALKNDAKTSKEALAHLNGLFDQGMKVSRKLMEPALRRFTNTEKGQELQKREKKRRAEEKAIGAIMIDIESERESLTHSVRASITNQDSEIDIVLPETISEGPEGDDAEHDKSQSQPAIAAARAIQATVAITGNTRANAF